MLGAHRLLEAARSPRPAAGRRRGASASSSETRSPSIVAQSSRATRVSPAVSTLTATAPASATASAVSSKRAAHARVLVAVVEEDRGERCRRRASQPQISLWSASGSTEKKAGAWRSRSPGSSSGARPARSGRRRRRPGRCSASWAAISAAWRLQRLALLGEEGGGGVDLGVDARCRAGQRRHLGDGGEHVGDGGAGLEDPRQADHRQAGLAGLGRPAARRC